jgi:sigma-B regulation protein RsbU (phosphoserine phosphatase)
LDYIKEWYKNIQIHQMLEEKQNTRRLNDLVEASEIQMSLINTDFSQFEKRKDIDLYAIYKPARIVSGDLYDFFFIDDENLFFSIGDVSGKGVSAAFFMSVAQTVIKSNVKYKNPKEIVRMVNNELCINNNQQFFLTLFIGILNLKTGKLAYCNAAHTSTFIIKSNKEITELGRAHGLPLGIYPNKKYFDAIINLDSYDTILVFTDGVIEVENEKNEHLGIDAFREILKDLSHYNPVELILHIEKELDEFKGENKLFDDIAIMAIKLKDIKKA